MSKNKPHINDMTQEEFIGAIQKAGWSPSSLARHLECSQSMIYHLAASRTKSDRLLRAIADLINVPVWKIRPSIYMGGGPKKPGRPFHLPPFQQ